MPKRVIILGSTGSIGRSALDVVAAMPGEFEVVGLAANRGWELLAQQAAEHRTSAVALADKTHAADFQRQLKSHGAAPATFFGSRALIDLVEQTKADFVLSAVVGAAALPATLAAVARGLSVGLANKEALVVAGSILMPLAKKTGAKLIPVDSEHSAIFQCLVSGHSKEVKRVHLTASGGPFRTWPPERIQEATLADALKHPTWSMGPKITIDSATMMNKALEIVEAHHLFELPGEKIDVLIHPESIVHSMVEFCDGSLIAQLGTPDMRTPIQYAITFPRRLAAVAPSLDWTEARRLHFEPPDPDRFPALRLGYEAARRGGTAGSVINAANEAAVQAFRDGLIPFGKIVPLIANALERHVTVASPTLEQLLAADAWARQEVTECIVG